MVLVASKTGFTTHNKQSHGRGTKGSETNQNYIYDNRQQPLPMSNFDHSEGLGINPSNDVRPTIVSTEFRTCPFRIFRTTLGDEPRLVHHMIVLFQVPHSLLVSGFKSDSCFILIVAKRHT